MNTPSNRPSARGRTIARAERMAGYRSTPEQIARAQQVVEHSMIRTFGELQFETALVAIIREDHPERKRPRPSRPAPRWAIDSAEQLRCIVIRLRHIIERKEYK